MGKASKEDLAKELAPAPHAVQAFEFLRENLVGESFPKRYQSIVGNYVLESSLRPGSALEDLSFTLLRRRFKSAQVLLEPLGRETFPDLLLSFSTNARQYFEVKSKSAETRRMEIDLASTKMLYSQTVKGESAYWEAYYLLWTYKDAGNSVTVTDLEMGQLWQLAGITESGAVKLGSGGSGRTKYVQRGLHTFSDPLAFRKGLLTAYRQQGYADAEVDLLARESAKIVKRLWPLHGANMRP